MTAYCLPLDVSVSSTCIFFSRIPVNVSSVFGWTPLMNSTRDPRCIPARSAILPESGSRIIPLMVIYPLSIAFCGDGRRMELYSPSARIFGAIGLVPRVRNIHSITIARRKFIVTHATSTSARAHQDFFEKLSGSSASGLVGSSHWIRTKPPIGSALNV